MNNPFTPDEQKRIVEAIRQAEKATSGEIRVHVEPHCANADPVQRAIEVFAHLGMHQTKEQNGVLFYLAHTDRKFAVLGDKGIDAKVPANFWESTKDLLRSHFAAGTLCRRAKPGYRTGRATIKTVLSLRQRRHQRTRRRYFV